MSLVVLRDSREIYDLLQPKQPSPQRALPHISVSAPGLDEQVRSDLQSDIQAVLERTMRQVHSAQPTARREPLSDDQIREMIRVQLSSPRPSAPQRQRPQSNGGIRVVTSGLSLPPQHRRAFKSEVLQLVQERLDGLSQPQVTVCGCGWPFNGCCWPPAGDLADLTQIDPLPASKTQPISIALFFAGENLIHGDAIHWRIWNEFSGLPPDQMLVGLRIDPTQDPDQWAKEITGWTTCQCTVQTDHVENGNPAVGYNWMFVFSNVNTLAFRKAVFLGWHNSGYLGPTPEEVWKLLGGKIMTFDWICDECG